MVLSVGHIVRTLKGCFQCVTDCIICSVAFMIQIKSHIIFLFFQIITPEFKSKLNPTRREGSFK